MFITAFSQQPTAKTYPQPDQGFGGFDSFSHCSCGERRHQARCGWERSRGGEGGLADLIKTAGMCGGGVTFGNGVTSIQFVSHIAHNREVPPWTVGVIKARGTEVFYALGMGDSTRQRT